MRVVSSLINRVAGRKIEMFQSSVADCPTDFDRIGILLLLAGEKRAIEWLIFSEGARSRALCAPVDDVALAAVLSLAGQLGLRATALNPEVIEAFAGPEPYATRVIIVIARHQGDLIRAANLWSGGCVKQSMRNIRAHGELSGFPASSIASYLADRSIMPHELSLPVRLSPAYAFGRFRLSRNGWRGELGTGRRWASIVRRDAPALYDHYLGRSRIFERANELTYSYRSDVESRVS